MWHLSEARPVAAPEPQKGTPGATPGSRDAAWRGGPGPDADDGTAAPIQCVSDDEGSVKRSASPACIERAQHDPVPTPPPPPARVGSSPASRVAASYTQLASLRVNDGDDPQPRRQHDGDDPQRRRARSLDADGFEDPRRAVPKHDVSESRREDTLRDALLPARPPPVAEETGFVLGLMRAIGCCGSGEDEWT